MPKSALPQEALEQQPTAPADEGFYAKWSEAVSVVDGPFPGRPFTSEELGFACRWAVAQRDLGMVARLLPDVDGAVRVLSIAGAANIPAEWVIYPCDDGIRSVESVFGSTSFPSLVAALLEIHEMPKPLVQAVSNPVQAGHGLACA